MNLWELLNSADVHERIKQYSDGAMFMSAYGPFLAEFNHRPFEVFELSDLGKVTHHLLDTFRSLWDRDSIILMLDVERFSKPDHCEKSCTSKFQW